MKRVFLGIVSCLSFYAQQIEFSCSGGMDIDRFAKFQKRFHHETIIETGTYYAVTAVAASKFYKKVYTIELSDELYKMYLSNPSYPKHITFIHGYSDQELKKLMERMTLQSTFVFLDAHFSAGVTAKSENDPPLLDELVALQPKVRDSSVILIDDVRCFKAPLKSGYKDYIGYPKLSDLKSYVDEKYPKGFEFVIIGDQAIIYNPSNFNELVSLGAKYFTKFYLEKDIEKAFLFASKCVRSMTRREKLHLIKMANHEVTSDFILYIAALLHSRESTERAEYINKMYQGIDKRLIEKLM